MTPTAAPLNRHQLAAALAGLWVLILSPPAAAAVPAPVVTILGDSITAGYGLPAAAAFPAQLAGDLARVGVPAQVRAAGVSGDTTADGLARVDFSVQGDTRVCVVALGGNDLLQGLDPKVTKANLVRLIARLKARHIRVILVGMTAPKAIGTAYARDYDAAFPAAARAAGVAFYPDLLAGVARNRALNQSDGIHPNAAGAAVIAARLAPFVARSLRQRARTPRQKS